MVARRRATALLLVPHCRRVPQAVLEARALPPSTSCVQQQQQPWRHTAAAPTHPISITRGEQLYPPTHTHTQTGDAYLR